MQNVRFLKAFLIYKIANFKRDMYFLSPGIFFMYNIFVNLKQRNLRVNKEDFPIPAICLCNMRRKAILYFLKEKKIFIFLSEI